MLDIIPSFLTAFLITFFAIPSIIKIAYEKNLCDEPGERRSHTRSIPTLGGLGIFAGLIFAVTFWIPFDAVADNGSHRHVQYLLCSYIVIFLIGAKDDIIPLTPSKKFAGQLLAAVILVVKGDVRLTSLYGILGIGAIPVEISYPLSIFVIVVIINSLNLIDGINGLSGSIGCIFCGVFGYYFYITYNLDLAVLAAAMGGALIAFLRYNFSHSAQIFMGDTGSLLIGLTASILAIEFIEMNPHQAWPILSTPAVAIGVLIIPLFDTLRVFTLRILKGRSPFSPDRTHVHHLLLDVGCSHIQATAVLIVVNLCFIGVAYSLKTIGTLELSLVLLSLAGVLSTILQTKAKRQQERIARIQKAEMARKAEKATSHA